MVKALEQMLPYLVLKREQARLVIELQKRRWEAKAKGCKELDQNELATRERIYQRIKMLQGKVRQLSFNVEDTNTKQRQLF